MEKFTPEIMEGLNIKYTMVAEIRGYNKEKKANEVLEDFADREIDGLTVAELSAYAGGKKGTPESKQYAMEEMVRKINRGVGL